jgi:ribosomal-protein-alanine N-acetyltransferase
MQVSQSINTERLRLIPATVKSMEAEIHSPASLASYLKLRLPKYWPPPLNDDASQRWMLAYLQQHEGSRWGMWYITLPGRPSQLVGNCGYKGAPKKGAVEIGYAIAPEFQRKGYASEAVRGLLRFAFAAEEVKRVLAETLPELTPSIGVLRKCGFHHVQGGSEPGILRFSIARARWNNATTGHNRRQRES